MGGASSVELGLTICWVCNVYWCSEVSLFKHHFMVFITDLKKEEVLNLAEFFTDVRASYFCLRSDLFI